VRDVGLLHALLDLETHDRLMGHQRVGASFEGFVIEQILPLLGTRTRISGGPTRRATRTIYEEL
jgi:hypothetical protein